MASLNELKSVMRHSAVYALSNILAKFIGFLMIPVYTRYLTPADYGVIELLDMTVTIITTFVGLNFSAAVLRFYYACKSDEERRALLSTALISVTVLAATVALLLMPLKSFFAEWLFKSQAYAFYFPIILTTIVFQIVTEYCLSFVQIKQQSVKYASFAIVRILIGLSLNIYFVVVKKLGPSGIIYSSLLTCMIMGTVLGVLTYSDVRFNFSKLFFKRMVAFGAPLIVSGASTFIVTFSDRYFLNHFALLSEVGVYSLGYKIAMLIGVLVTGPFFSIWNPKRFELNERGVGERLQTSAFSYFFVLIVLASLALSVFIPEVLHLVATPPFYKAANLVPVIVLGYIFYASYYHFRFGIHVAQKTSWDAYLWAAGSILNLILNYFLIKAFTSMGAAFSTTLTYLAIAIATHFIAQRIKPMPQEFGRLGLAFCAGLVLYGIARLSFADVSIVAFSCKVLIVAAYPIVLFVFGYFRKEEITMAKDLTAGIFKKFGMKE